METITNYKLKDFLLLDNPEIITEYIALLELLEPLEGIRHLRKLSFGNVTNIRDNLNYPTLENIIESVKLITDKTEEEIFEMEIIEFYSIVNGLKKQAIQLSSEEENELSSEDTPWELEAVNAPQKMARFGVLNTINSLAGDDITKWRIVEELPYMVVFTKLKMDKERAAINKEVYELQKKKQNY